MANDTARSNPEADVAAVQQKYAEERNKRLRPEGYAQYVDVSTSEKFKRFRDDPWIDPDAAPFETLKNGDNCSVLILGAGFGGLLFAVRLLEAGINVDDIRIVDSAGGFGGAWYWNRFPGLMCDIESYIYMPLLEEMNYMPKHKYSSGPELRDYANSIAEKYELKDKAMFQTQVTGINWDDKQSDWVVNMLQRRPGDEKSEITVRSKFIITSAGHLSYPKLPDVPGLGKFEGHSFHTSRWDYKFTGGSPIDPSLTNLKDKRVGIIGTGATAVQAVPQLAKWSKELYVFQRTPSAIARRDNRPTDAEWWGREMRGKKGWQKERAANFNAFISDLSPLPSIDMVDDAWSNMRFMSVVVKGAAITSDPASIYSYIASIHAKDLPRQEMIRQRVDEMVHDPSIAEKLKPWYPGWCKRLCFHDEYLPTFNRPNVTLVDTDGKGIDSINERGLVFGGKEYKLDVLIFATGFSNPFVGNTGRGKVSIIGRNGKSLDEKFTNNMATLHGVISRDFPNYFFPGPFQTGITTNFVNYVDSVATHIAYVLSEVARKAGSAQKFDFTVEPTEEAEEAWTMKIMAGAAGFAASRGCTPGFFNLEGEADRLASAPLEVQMKAARASLWSKGFADYLNVLEDWRNKGDLEGLEIIRTKLK